MGGEGRREEETREKGKSGEGRGEGEAEQRTGVDEQNRLDYDRGRGRLESGKVRWVYVGKAGSGCVMQRRLFGKISAQLHALIIHA